MMAEDNRSIQQKLMRVILLTSGTVLLFTFASYLIYGFISYRQMTLRHISSLGEIIAGNSTAALAFDSKRDAEELLMTLRSEEDIVAAFLFDQHGNLFASFSRGADMKIPVLGEHGFRFTEGQVEGFVPVLQGDKFLGTLYLQKSAGAIYERLILYALIGACIFGLIFLLAYFISKRLQQGISFPVMSLAQTARAISEHGDYSVRTKISSGDEIGFLARAFNQMLERIEQQNAELVLARESAQQHALDLERKVKERTVEYKTQKDFVEAILEASIDVIGVFDTETRLIAANKQFEKQYKLTKEKAIGKTLLELFPNAHESFERIMKALAGETMYYPYFKSNIIDRYFETYVIPLKDHHNKVYAILVTAHDITPSVKASEILKETADQLRVANDSLLRKNNELEQFAYVASHDLQEPLRKIQTFIQLVRKTDDTGAAQRYLEKIEMSAGRMSALIKDVLEYSRLSQPHEAFVDTDLNEILENVKIDFELLIAQRNAVINSDRLPVLPVNKLQIHQLFANLIGNSIKFSQTNPVITITCANASAQELDSLSLSHHRPLVKISFADNGIGFEQEFSDKIFTIFQRLNTREKFEGTGIGLALCKKIVENHNGYITATSRPGFGSVFTVFLPGQTVQD